MEFVGEILSTSQASSKKCLKLKTWLYGITKATKQQSYSFNFYIVGNNRQVLN